VRHGFLAARQKNGDSSEAITKFKQRTERQTESRR
jgi:hypothetical protein